MQKYITRTIDFTKISGFVMQIGGDNEKISVEPILEVGKIDEKRATKIFRKKYGYNALITQIEHISEVYRMSVEKFMEASDKVNEEE